MPASNAYPIGFSSIRIFLIIVYLIRLIKTSPAPNPLSKLLYIPMFLMSLLDNVEKITSKYL